MQDKQLQFFTSKLLKWAENQDRNLPWKKTQNPYYIWLSEIILQQTRVEQGKPYYEKFVKNYPTVTDLADAPEDDVLKLWQGLGYYSRARNLHFTAKYIKENYQGIFPKTYEEIRALKGVGDYTAAAIASFSYNLPHAVVDGNVYRVLSRFFGIETAIDTTLGKKTFAALAQELLPKRKAAVYNQAIMDFGATHCKPKQALCTTCLHQKKCVAFTDKKVNLLPVKSKKIKKKDRFFYYLVCNSQGETQLLKREGKDIWQGLYQFPMIELDKLFDQEELEKNDKWKGKIGDAKFKIQRFSKPYKQTLSHQRIVARFIEIDCTNEFFLQDPKIIKIKKTELLNFAFPKIIDTYCKDKSPSLNF
ncbi:MAG: A/G-specific adenine glycosylase [Saprospiraceae bacterium]|nr:A/G-specific adenine glycosylase [Saprospiraceae bacterium]